MAFAIILIIAIIIGILIFLFTSKKSKGQENSVSSLNTNTQERPGYTPIKNLEDFCPYCKQKLEAPPQRKKKCPHCQEMIYVKRRIGSKKKELVTAVEAQKIEREWNQKCFKDKWISKLGISENEYSIFFKKRQADLGRSLSEREAMRSLIIQKIDKEMKKKDRSFSNLRELYLNLAYFSDEEGIDFFNPLKEFFKWELLNEKKLAESAGFTNPKVKIVSCDCEKCKKAEGEVFSIEEALEKMPLPHPDCERYQNYEKRGFCICTYDLLLD